MKAAPSSGSSETASFIELADRLKTHFDACGVPLRTYKDPSLPHFSKLPLDAQKTALAMLEGTLSLLEEMVAHGEKPKDSSRLLWRSLHRLGWRPMSDIFDKIEEEDVVEIYTPNNIQAFRNLNFFRYISITLEEICSHAWYQVAQLDAHATEYYMTLAPLMLENKLTETFRNPLANYVVHELMGDRCKILAEPRWLSPLYDSKQCVGIISVIRCKMIDPPDDEE